MNGIHVGNSDTYHNGIIQQKPYVKEKHLSHISESVLFLCYAIDVKVKNVYLNVTYKKSFVKPK